MTRFLLALAVLSLALVAPVTASAAWLPIEEVGTIEPSDQEFRMAANDRGDTVAMWRDGRGIQVSVSKRGGPFGEARTVPGSRDGTSADVDVNEDGRAIIWWREFVPPAKQRGKLIGLRIDGGFGKPRVVTPTADYLTFRPTIGPNGRFVIVYTVNSRFRPVYARIAPPSGKLGRRITLASGSIQIDDLWYLVNRAMVAYRQASDDYRRLHERQVGSGGARVIANVPRNGIVALDTASNGRQIALWTAGNTDTLPTRPLTAAVRRPGRTFGEGKVLDNRFPPQETAVAISRSGEGIVAWRDWNESTTEDGESPTPDASPGTIVYSYHWAGLGFSAMGRIRPGDENGRVESLTADVNSEGRAMLGWNGGRFNAMQRRLYTAQIYRGDPPEIYPMTDYDDLGFRFAQVEVDENERSVFGWVDETKVIAQRGTWSVSQP